MAQMISVVLFGILTHITLAGLQTESFSWLLERTFSPPAPPSMYAWVEFSTEAYDAIWSLVSPSASKVTADRACQTLHCTGNQKKQLKMLALGRTDEGWAFVRWALQHYASGVALAEQAVRHIASLSNASDTCSHAPRERGLAIPKSRDFDMKSAMWTLLQYPQARHDTLTWLGKKHKRKSFPKLDALVRKTTRSFVHALESLNAHLTDGGSVPGQTLQTPIAVLEARQARVFNAVLDTLSAEDLNETLSRRSSSGFSLLQEAALHGAAAHVMVIRRHARKAAAEEHVLSFGSEPVEWFGAEAPVAITGFAAPQLALRAGQCAALLELETNGTKPDLCPQRGVGLPRDIQNVTSQLDESRPSLDGVRDWPEERMISELVLSRDCDISSIKFSHDVNWSKVLAEHAALEQPLRITGMGQVLTETDPTLFEFGSLTALCRFPWADIKYEVGAIPFASDFLKDTVDVMQLCKFARAVNRSMMSRKSTSKRKAPKYWFAEHHSRNDIERHSGFTITDQRTHKPLERSRVAVLGALGLKPDPLDMTQLALGPAWSGAPLHMHMTGLNLALMGSRRWLLLPQREGYWSNMPIREWWHSRAHTDASHQMRECMQHPGDLIFLPPFYVHGVLNVRASLVLSWTQTQDYM